MIKTSRKKKLGQTALEYALVLGVISVGVIMAGKFLFGDKEGPANQLMQGAIEHAQDTYDGN